MKTILIYLSSTTYKWWNWVSYRWKINFIKELYDMCHKELNNEVDFKLIDPLLFKSEDPIVCDMDIADINRCHYVVAYLDKLTIGTLFEIAYVIFLSKFKKNYNMQSHIKLCVISKNKYVLNHPWIKRLCDGRIVKNVGDAAKMIINEVKDENGKNRNNSTV